MDELKSTAQKTARELLMAISTFNCKCGQKVKRGDNFILLDHDPVCLNCGLPARRLTPIKR